MASVKEELRRIEAERAKLAQEESDLIGRRQSEIGALFVKAGLVEIEDVVFLGVIAELKAEPAGSPRLAQLAEKGAAIAPKKPGRKAQA